MEYSSLYKVQKMGDKMIVLDWILVILAILIVSIGVVLIFGFFIGIASIIFLWVRSENKWHK